MMRSRRESSVLFRDGDLHQWLGARLEGSLREVEGLSEDALLASPIDDLVETIFKRHQVEMVAVDRDGISVVEQGDASVPKNDFGRKYVSPVHGVSFAVPFTGDPNLFRYQGSSLSSMFPRADVGANELTITVLSEDADSEHIRQKLNGELNLIQQYLGGVTPMVSEYNQRLPHETRSRLEARKKRILDRRGLVQNLGFPVRPRGQQAISVPLARKRIIPTLPPAPPGGFQPEPAITETDYDAILQTMQQMTLVMERNPGSFSHVDEETIRSHFLVPLNAQFEGAATGETFNGDGKTDILIRVQGKNVFIAECKFWKGPDSLSKAIDQLMGYLSWRDTKCAVVVLVRDTEISTVLAKVPEVVRNYVTFKREKAVAVPTWFRAVLHHPEDRNREVMVTVMVFNVPRS